MSLNRSDLVAGTRPDLRKKIIMTASPDFDGYEIIEYKGMVWGLSMRAKDIGQDCAMGCKNLTGGELSSYTALGDESRQKAIDRMLSMAGRLGANGIIDFRFEQNMAAQGAMEVTAHGTAVLLKPIKNYVPTGAIGNILAELTSTRDVLNMTSTSSKSQQVKTVQDHVSLKYPLALLKQRDGKLLAKCPSCQTLYNVSDVIGDELHDYDLSEPGQQARCRKCEAIFTLPEIDGE